MTNPVPNPERPDVEGIEANARAVLADHPGWRVTASIVALTAYTRHLEAEKAALEARLEGEGWRPIETAPKDGTRILVWRESVVPGAPYCDVTAWPKNWGALWPTAYMHYADGHEPTHWRPLPVAPSPTAIPACGQGDQASGDRS